jgi:hypothetical protein
MRFHGSPLPWNLSTLNLGSACQDIFIFSLGFCKRLGRQNIRDSALVVQVGLVQL